MSVDAWGSLSHVWRSLGRWEKTFSEMAHTVGFHGPFLVESFAADFTSVWFFTCVYPLVHNQVILVRKCFTAIRACQRLICNRREVGIYRRQMQVKRI